MDNFYLRVIDAFNSMSVRYVVVGGFAVNFHGYNRTTGDLDLWISNTNDNLQLLQSALSELEFDLSSEAISELKSDRMVTFSEDDCVVELMTRLNISTETSFDEAYERSVVKSVSGIDIRVVSLDDLINEKSKSKKYKDLDDLAKLEEAKVYYGLRSKEK